LEKQEESPDANDKWNQEFEAVLKKAVEDGIEPMTREEIIEYFDCLEEN
jgi:hypothetical protein